MNNNILSYELNGETHYFAVIFELSDFEMLFPKIEEPVLNLEQVITEHHQN